MNFGFFIKSEAFQPLMEALYTTDAAGILWYSPDEPQTTSIAALQLEQTIQRYEAINPIFELQ